ncbi:cyclic nucleotide-binding domain-containing protein [uncultured Salipiger sp.]|uniref:cyclic nucleotide-binding domain-containing protein n=1 Tax=uncultured Salipiger sp. TaxID=499810 RepID=UPI002593C8DF|nr:cyclic nucleotide-binding domain-containing protein [uncultured Salipiger sp.]
MAHQTIRDILADHPAFLGFEGAALDLIADCGLNMRYRAGDLLFREGDAAETVLILRHGDAAIELAAPGRGTLRVESLHPGDIVDWSWLLPPCRAMSDARAVTDVAAIALDARCVLDKCDEHTELGYRLFRLWLPHLARRVRMQRLQLLDLYGSHAR